MSRLSALAFVFLLSIFGLLPALRAQTTEVTYQGQLQSSSVAATGDFDFEFSLFSLSVGGSQIGPTVARNNVPVANGIFSVNLDFGSSFPGASRFLEIRVRQSGGGAFTTLLPRQPVNSTPYAIKSLSSDSAALATNAANAGVATNFSGNLVGDVTGTQTATTVARLQNRNVANTPPLDGQVLKYNGAAGQWRPDTDIAGSGGGGGTITGVTPGTGLTGGGATGNVTLNIANSGVGTQQLADGSVTDAKIATVSAAKVTGTVANATTAVNATTATTANSATNFTGNLAGDVTGTQAATVVNTVGGQTAPNIANAAQSVSAATANNTPNTLVRRDGSGNFVAGTITGNLSGNATTATTATNAINATNATNATTAVNATNFTGNLAGDVTGPQGNTVVSTFGGMSAATVSNAVQTVSASTPNNTPNAIVRRDGAGNFAAGTITGNLAGNASTATNASQLGGVAAGQYVLTGDARLSDARTPLAGSTNYIQNQNAGAQAVSNFNISGSGTAGGTLSGNIVSATTQYNIGGNRILSVNGSGNLIAGRNAANAGGFNSFFGDSAGGSNLASGNSFFGTSAGLRNTGGPDNSFFGTSVGSNNTTGAFNSFFGSGAGVTNVSGNNNTAVGQGADVGTGNLTFATAIGSQSTVSTSNTIVLGRGLTDDVIASNRMRVRNIPLLASAAQVCFNAAGDLLQCGASSLRWKSNVQTFSDGLNVVRRLRPISYDWKDGSGSDIGLGAEDVDRIAPSFAFRNKEGVVEGVRYERLNMLLINAVNEQQEQIEKLRTENAALNKRLQSLERSVEKIIKKAEGKTRRR